MTEPAGANGVTLNASDLKILAAAFKHSQTPLKPDYKLMATELGYSNIGSASNAWSKVSKKILGADIGPSPRKAAAASKKTAGKKGRQEGTEEDEEQIESPKKRRKATKSRYITREDDEDEDEKANVGGIFDDDVGGLDMGSGMFGVVKEEEIDDA